METALQLLMRDGAVHVRFRPRLTAAQYADLASLIEGPDTKQALCQAVEEWAKKHGVLVVVCEDAY
jgi:hypothetical protein